MATIFLSYRRGDAADAAGRIYDRLVRQFGEDAIYMDVDSIPLGEDFVRHIETHVQSCLVMVVVIGPHWIGRTGKGHDSRIKSQDDFVRTELELGIKHGLAIMPLLVSGASMPTADQLPSSLQWLPRRNAFPVGPNPNFHRDMDRVIAAVEVRRATVEEERRRRDEAQRQARERENTLRSSSGTAIALSPSTSISLLTRVFKIAADVERYQLTGIMRIFRRAPVAFLIVGLLGAAASEGLAAHVTGIFPPTWLADSAAAVIGVAVGGIAALVTGFQQLFTMVIRAVELTIAETERYAAELIPAPADAPRLPSMSEGADAEGRVPPQTSEGDGRTATARSQSARSQSARSQSRASSSSITSTLSFISKYALNAIARTFRGSFLAFVVVGVLAAAASEIIAAYATGIFPPVWLTNVGSGVIGIAVGAVVALVMALGSFFRAIISAIELLAMEAERFSAEERSEQLPPTIEESHAIGQLTVERASREQDPTAAK